MEVFEIFSLIFAIILCTDFTHTAGIWLPRAVIDEAACEITKNLMN